MEDNNINNIDKTLPTHIDFLFNISKDSYTNYILDNSFIIFLSVNNILFLVYYSEERNIILYVFQINKKYLN